MTEIKYAGKGFVALVHVKVPGGANQREAYVVGCATDTETTAKIREMYPTDDIEVTVSPMSDGDVKGLKLLPGEARPWQ